MKVTIRRVNYAIRLKPTGFWWHWWTPIWHEGRGPYISIGCGLVTLHRGY
jgi:hypothetical protein